MTARPVLMPEATFHEQPGVGHLPHIGAFAAFRQRLDLSFP